MKARNTIIKNYCKSNKLKFDKETEIGFTATTSIPVSAGMQFGTGAYKIQPVSKKIIKLDFILHNDGDIVSNGVISTEIVAL